MAVTGSAIQPQSTIPIIGFLGPNSPDKSLDIRGFLIGLRDLGYIGDAQASIDSVLPEIVGRAPIRGDKITIVTRFAQGKEDILPTLANELLRFTENGQSPRVIVATSTLAAREVKNEAQRIGSTIPIVIGLSGDPKAARLVDDLEQPGGTVTGISEQNLLQANQQLALLREAVTPLECVGTLSHNANPSTVGELEAARDAARQLGIRLAVEDVNSADDFPEKLNLLIDRDGAQALLVLGDPIFVRHGDVLRALLEARRLPAMWGSVESAESGGLIAYGARHFDLFRRSAYFVHRILEGAEPATMPVEWFPPLILVVNLRTANDIGRPIPQAIQDRADIVIPIDPRP